MCSGGRADALRAPLVSSVRHHRGRHVPRITLTDFTDIVAKAGTPKATKVAQLKNRPVYDPAADFYKALREGLVNLHEHGGVKGDVLQIAKRVTDPKKVANYPVMLTGYKKWWGRKVLRWFDPPGDIYSKSGIDVAVNPELGLEVNGMPCVIKLHLKSEPLSKTRADLVVTLMHTVLGTGEASDPDFAILDVRQSKLFTFAAAHKNFQPMVDAELSYIATLWPQV